MEPFINFVQMLGQGGISNRVKIALRAVAILSLLVVIIYPAYEMDKEKDVALILPKFFPEGSSFIKITGKDSIHFEAYNESKELIGFVFPTEQEGYGGPIKFFTITDTGGKIERVHVFEHRETPEYVTEEGLSNFLAQLKGRRIDQGFLLHGDVDAITKATITSFFILEGVNEAGKRALQIGVFDEERARYRGRLRIRPEVWVLISLFFFSILAYLSRRRALRWAILLFTIVFLGFIQSYILSLSVLVSILSVRLPLFWDALFWFLIYGFALLSVILAGRFYCGWLCPFGAAQDFLGMIKPIRGGLSNRIKRNVRIPESFDRHLRSIKYLLLWGFLFFALVRRNPQLADYEPYTTLFTLQGSILSWVYLIFFLVLGTFSSRLWCRYFCAAGAALALLSPLCRRKLQIGEECDGCYRCLNICPMGAIRKTSPERVEIDYSECIECNLCLRVCTKGPIGRETGPFPKE